VSRSEANFAVAQRGYSLAGLSGLQLHAKIAEAQRGIGRAGLTGLQLPEAGFPWRSERRRGEIGFLGLGSGGFLRHEGKEPQEGTEPFCGRPPGKTHQLC
jgi:hypothetical protein